MKKAFGTNLLKQRAKKFAGNEGGAVALIIGIALVAVLIGVLSLTIDLGRTQTSYNKMQQATDAAAAGTAEYVLKHLINQIGKVKDPLDKPPSQADIRLYAKNLLEQNFKTDQTSATFDPTSLNVVYANELVSGGNGLRDYGVTVSACADLVTKIADAAKHTNKTRTCTTSNAGFSMRALSNLEVAFALDFTNSMYWKGDEYPSECLISTPTTAQDNTSKPNCPAFANTKAKALVDSMNFVFDNYMSNGSSIYASIVPYAAFVNIWPYSNTMVQQDNSDATRIIPTDRYYEFQNLSGSSYQNAFRLTRSYTDYQGDMAYVLNRIPILSSTNQIANIINSDGDPNSFTTYPFQSYRSLYSSLADDNIKYLCYNTGIMAGLDQRIEKAVKGGKGIVVTPTVADYVVSADGVNLYNQNTTKPTKSPKIPYTLPYLNRTTSTGVETTHELHESFPIQPLTNNVNILRSMINRFTASTRLYDDVHNTDASITGNFNDRQSNILNKSSSFSYFGGTSSIHGLMWAWFTISNKWQDRWNDRSLHEMYYGADGDASLASRSGLPSASNFKHIIFLTDGRDNDGTNKQCDAFSPVSSVPEASYQALCTRIKQDNIKIHTILLDVSDTSASRYRNCSTDATTFHENVQPAQLQTIMDGIFKQVVTDLVTVRLRN